MAKEESKQLSPDEAKLKALQAAMSKIEKDFGKGSIMKMGDEQIENVEVIPTGSIGLDVALGVGGYPRGRIIEADPGSDKQGEGGEHKFKIALVYWKETLDGQEILELDVLANKASFGGKDERAGLRKALGMM